MRKRGELEARRDAQDRDYGQDWKDHAAWNRWKRDGSELQMILDAKAKGAVAALPVLMDKMRAGKCDPETEEAVDAVFAIIIKNPGNSEILALIPYLVDDLECPERRFDSANVLCAIAESNPRAPEFSGQIFRINDRIERMCEMEKSIDLVSTLESLARVLGLVGDLSVFPVLKLLAESHLAEAGSELERQVYWAIDNVGRQIQR